MNLLGTDFLFINAKSPKLKWLHVMGTNGSLNGHKLHCSVSKPMVVNYVARKKCTFWDFRSFKVNAISSSIDSGYM
jgi:hypothetical protein